MVRAAQVALHLKKSSSIMSILLDLFEDYDRALCGTVNLKEFNEVLQSLNVHITNETLILVGKMYENMDFPRNPQNFKATILTLEVNK